MTKPSVACIIVGIDGWNKFTLPLIQSIEEHEPTCEIVVIDNASVEPYVPTHNDDFTILRTERLSYSSAINTGQSILDNADWYIVLSNDVLCTGPFLHLLEGYGDGDVVGPLLKHTHGFDYIEGWCVATPKRIWDAVGGWDEKFIGSSWEDVSFSTDARLKGFGLVEDTSFPFVHLDQRQRFTVIPNYWTTEEANIKYMREKYAGVL